MLDIMLRQLSFTISSSEHARYVGGRWRVTGADVEEISEFKEEMMKNFRMSDLGLLLYYLGIEVCQNATNITLAQAGYAGKLLEHAGMAECNPALVQSLCSHKSTR
jgi:hypothetical protein